MANPDQIKKETINNNQPSSSDQLRPSISLCMIVKNEEKFLENCLNSISGFVDEIIIVDTGSTDKTVEIAERFTDKIFSHPWENSFSKARNHAREYATCDWIFQIDADEELVSGGEKKIHEAVSSAGDADIIFVTIISKYSNGERTASHNFERLFRNNGVIHYEGAVHNRIVGGVKPVYSSIQLIHHGYNVDSKTYEAKFKRTTDLLKKEITDDPLNPMYHHYLGVSYLSMQMDNEAKKESELAISLADSQQDNNPLYLWSHFNASMANYRLGNLEKAEEYAIKSHKILNNHLDSCYMLAVIAAEKKDWKNVLNYSERYLSILKENENESNKADIIVNNTIKEDNLIFSLMGHAQYYMNNKEQMMKFYEKAFEASEDKKRIALQICSFHLDRTGDLGLSKHFLDKASLISADDLETRYVLAKYYKKAGSPEHEKQCLQWLFTKGSRDKTVLRRLIDLCVMFEELDIALSVTNEALNEVEDKGLYLEKKAEILRRKDDPLGAIKCYMAILEKSPGSGRIWNELGNTCMKMGKIKDAEIFFKKAASLIG